MRQMDYYHLVHIDTIVDIPIYSGGLGVLAGDTLKSAADLKLPLIWAFAVATVGSLFSADAWNNVTFLGEEVRDAERNVPRALVYGTGLVTTLYVLANVGYLNALPLSGIASAPGGPEAPLFLLNPATGRQRLLGKLGPGPGLTVSPDGKTILFARIVGGGHDLMMIENFR